MDLVPWRPFGEMSRLRKEMDNLMNRFFGETAFPKIVSEEWMPAVDISETKDNIIIKAELPGMEAKDVNVSISGDMLTIKGERRRKKKKKMRAIIIQRDTTGITSVHSGFRPACKVTRLKHLLTRVF